jgi:hypothetical protein
MKVRCNTAFNCVASVTTVAVLVLFLSAAGAQPKSSLQNNDKELPLPKAAANDPLVAPKTPSSSLSPAPKVLAAPKSDPLAKPASTNLSPDIPTFNTELPQSAKPAEPTEPAKAPSAKTRTAVDLDMPQRKTAAGSKSTTVSGSETASKTKPAAGKDEQNDKMTAISPAPAPDVDETMVVKNLLTPSEMFMNAMAWEAVSSSTEWRARWNAPDFGMVNVYSVLPGGVDIPRGVILPWRRDGQGFPEAVLHAAIRVPVLKRIQPTSLSEPLESATLSIKQYITFYYRSAASEKSVPGTVSAYKDGKGASYRLETPDRSIGGYWMASASPYYVTLVDKNKKVHTVVGVDKGRGSWNAMVGPGGILIKNFVEGGLASARTELTRLFRDEEIDWFLRGNSDVLFYLRPQHTHAY